jgi:pimeloyl-ACP methyl ester carboxylesterase
MNTYIRFIVVTLVSVLVCSCATLRNSKTIVLEGEKFSYAVAGNGPVTIVLEAGLGDGMDSWAGIFDELAKLTRVFAYDRPGYGGSSSTGRPRSAEQIVTDLHKLLIQTGIKPPYILMGHSLGGDYMLYFAKRYPLEVAGLILVETRHPDFTHQCLEQDLSGCEIPSLLYILLPHNVRREYDAAQQIQFDDKLGDIPIVVISRSSGPNNEPDKWLTLWMKTQKQLTELSAHSRYIVAKNSGHYVHKDEPTTVMKGIRWVLMDWKKYYKENLRDR